jgi:hypothetical protein
MKTKQFILIFAAMFFFLSTNPQSAYSQWVGTNKWEDRSDELFEGSIIDSKAFLIAGGVLVTGLITYLIVKEVKHKKSSSYSIGDSSGYLLARSSPTEGSSFYDKMENASQKSPVEIFTGPSNSNFPMDYHPHTGLAVGVRFKF